MRRQMDAALDWLESNSGGGGGPSSWSSITGKPSAFPPETHNHAVGDVTGLQTALDGKAASSHSHAIADVTGLQTALDSKADAATASPNYDGYTQMVPSAGLFIGNSANATALGTQAQVANRTIIAPFVPAYTTAIDQLGLSVSTLLAGASAKCVIFEADANGRPTTLLRETATIDAATTGTRFASITSLSLEAGRTYWIGVRASGTFTLRTLAVGALPALSYTNAATPAANQVLIRTETYATAAANWTYATGQHSNALMPLVLMRVA